MRGLAGMAIRRRSPFLGDRTASSSMIAVTIGALSLL